ncbi:MAG: DNA mismatch endonuclease Vsr [Paraburkholderia sp.]|nr:MAG: DNA mismatch endonuclease Vsr [Paraburkholderia sp.]
MRFVGQTTPERSRIMSAVRSRRNRSTELRLESILRAHRLFGWRRHLPLSGCPDFTFRVQRLVIFVDGCFWHGCPICYRSPRTNQDFWARKVSINRARDRQVNARLREQGWRVLRLWEHSLKDEDKVARRIRRALDLG